MEINASKPETIDEYISGFPPDVQEKLTRIRSIIHDAAPQAEETIKYQIPTFVLNGNLVHFAAFKSHIGLYPTPSGIEKFKDELKDVEISKGTIRFPLDRPIQYDLISEIVSFRVQENLDRAAAKAKKKRS
jgi:uncharacterized protein YdhG (YjbR/CyaY superfamily)